MHAVVKLPGLPNSALLERFASQFQAWCDSVVLKVIRLPRHARSLPVGERGERPSAAGGGCSVLESTAPQPADGSALIGAVPTVAMGAAARADANLSRHVTGDPMSK